MADQLITQAKQALAQGKEAWNAFIETTPIPVNTGATGYREYLRKLPDLLSAQPKFSYAQDQSQFNTSIADIQNILGGSGDWGQFQEATKNAVQAFTNAGIDFRPTVQQATPQAQVQLAGMSNIPTNETPAQRNIRETKARQLAVDQARFGSNFKLGDTAPITSESFNKTGTVDLSKTTGSNGSTGTIGYTDYNVNSATQQIMADIKARQDAINATKTVEQLQVEELSKQQVKDIESIAGKAAYETQKTQQLVSPLEQQLVSIQNQIQAKEADKARILADQQGKPVTMNTIIGAQAQINAVMNADILTLTAQANALMNNITLAQKQVQQAVDAKYAPIEERIAIATAQLAALQPTLTKQEKVQADALDAYYTAQKQALADKKTEEVNIQNLMIKAMENGITDQNLLNKISNSKSYTEALNIVSPVLGQQKKMEQDLDTAYKKAQIANVYSTIADRGGNTKQYDPSEILAYAQQYAGSGTIPTGLPKGSFGIVSQVAKELPKPVGTLVDVNTGIKPSKLSSAQIDGLSALSDVYKKAEELKELDKKRIGGIIAGTFGKIFGSKDQDNYMSIRSEIVDLLARARSGAALTQNEVNQYEAKLPSRFSEPFGLGTDSQVSINNFIKSIQGSLENKLQLNGAAIYGFSKVKVGNEQYTVGDIISNGTQTARVNADGSLTLIQQ